MSHCPYEATACSQQEEEKSPVAKRPNLLFVFADQMRGMDMTCAGNAQVRTPAMDRLAAQGTMFAKAYANCPVCTPSRAMMLTGLYPLSCRAIANDLPLPADVHGIGHMTRAAGYRTGYVGKWHLDGVPRSRFTPPGPRRHGFDYWAVWNCSHAYFQGKVFRDEPVPIALPGYEPEGQTDLALDFIRENDDRPFCLFLSWGPPHNPYEQVPDRYLKMYNPEDIDLRPNFRPIPPASHDLTRRADPQTTLAQYYAQITALDDQLARLLAALDESGISNDTIVVFTSDHGDMLWSQGAFRKQQPWEESISIPFLIRWPGRVPAGARSDALLSVADMAPSLLSLMGVENRLDMEGADISPAMLGQAPEGPASVFLMDVVTMDEAHHQGLREWRGIRTRTHTYARWADGHAWVLYDNETDPYQLNNLADKPEAEPAQATLERELQGWLKRCNDDCGPWHEHVRRLGLVDSWNAREHELHPRQPRLLD